MINALEIEHLTKNYGSFQLSDVSLTLPGGAIMGLIGENGAGKSTTIKCILNLIHRDGGSIRIFGKDNLQDEYAVKAQIGVVLDETTFPPVLKAPQVDKICSRLYPNWDSGLFRQYLRKFDLPERKSVGEYSRGMKMKLSIAAALSTQPRLLLLDEATGGLDPVVRDEILDEFLSFVRDEDHAILISSHITSDLEKLADYVTYLHRGQVLVQGTRDDLLETYGRLICTHAQLKQVDPALLAGKRESQFSCEALVRDRRDFTRRYPQLTVEPVTLEDIMVFTVRGETK